MCLISSLPLRRTILIGGTDTDIGGLGGVMGVATQVGVLDNGGPVLGCGTNVTPTQALP